MHLRPAAAALALLSLVLAPGVGARPTDTVSTATASGPGATVSTSGSASHPRAVTISIEATPTQKVTGTWSLVCSNGARSGQSGAITPLTRTFTFPAATSPARCTARATVHLSHDGRLTVQISRR